MPSHEGAVAADDPLVFVNAAIAATGQREFHADGREHGVPLDFLHEYMLVNYRALYAATLALDINDHNAVTIVRRLLATGRQAHEGLPQERALIARRACTAAAAGVRAVHRPAARPRQQPPHPGRHARVARGTARSRV